MHFPTPSSLLLTTAALTSIAVASRAASATPNLLSSAQPNDIWTNDIKLTEAGGYIHHVHLVSFGFASNDNIAKRDVVVSATTTKYDTKTLNTDIVTSSTLKTKEKVADSQSKVKAKNDQQPAIVYSAASTTKTAYSKEWSKVGASDTIPTGSAAHGGPNTDAVQPPPQPPHNPPASQSSQSSLSTTPVVKNTATTSTTPVTPPKIDAHPIKRSPGTFEYIYDSTTLIAVANSKPGNYASSHSLPPHTLKLKFGLQPLAAMPTKRP